MTHAYQNRVCILLSALLLELALTLICPDFSLATDLQTYGASGGTPFRDECPRGSYLVGLNGWAGEWVNRIAPVCAPWLRDKQTFGATTVGKYRGDSTGIKKLDPLCWGMGLNNRVIHSWEVKRLRGEPGQNEVKLVRYIKVYCTWLAPPAATGKFTFGGPITEDQGPTQFEKLGTYGADAPLYTACPANEVAIGIHGAAGESLDSIGLICGPSPAKFVAPPATNVNPLAMKPVRPATKVNPHAMAPEKAATGVNPLVAAPVPTPDMFTIVTPANNDRVQQGQLMVKATPPKIGAGTVTVLEFKYVDAPSNKPYSFAIAIETTKLLQGFLVPQQSTPGYAGRWEVRARTAAQPTPGPWSFPVQFQLFQTQPVQSQQQAPPPMVQQAPLPSTSVTTPSSAPTQMRRSSSMIMPRGVDKKDGTEGNQTVDQPAEAEKKP